MSDSLVTVATFLNPTNAHIAKGLLEEEGLDAVILDENMGNILPGLLMISEGGIPLQVREEDAERAKEILARFNDEGEADSEKTEGEAGGESAEDEEPNSK